MSNNSSFELRQEESSIDNSYYNDNSNVNSPNYTITSNSSVDTESHFATSINLRRVNIESHELYHNRRLPLRETVSNTRRTNSLSPNYQSPSRITMNFRRWINNFRGRYRSVSYIKKEFNINFFY
jgi:hypothetical protein